VIQPLLIDQVGDLCIHFMTIFLFIDGLGFLGAGGDCLITWIFIFIFCNF
jgi:hypothetical protein